MGQHRQQIHIDRQTHAPDHDVVPGPGRDVHRLRQQPQQHRHLGRRPVCEVEAQTRPDRLGTTRPLQMQLDDQIPDPVERPRHPIGQHRRGTARDPSQKMSRRKPRRRHRAPKSADRIGRVPSAGLPRRIEQQARMVDRGIPWLELEGPHKAIRARRDGHHEVPVDIPPLRTQRVGFREVEDQIRRSQGPFPGRCRRLRTVLGPPLRQTRGDPGPDDLDLRISQPPLTDKVAMAPLRHPGRHCPRLDRLQQLARLRPRLFIGPQWERSDGPRLMARRAVPVQDRCHIPVEGRLRAGGNPAPNQQSQPEPFPSGDNPEDLRWMER